MQETENPLVTVCLECTTPLRLKLFGISTSKYFMFLYLKASASHTAALE
jgi:hypothetical protein